MGQATLVFQVSSKQDLRITSPPPNWVDIPVGTTVNHQLSAVGGIQPYNWAIQGLPGMSVSNTGLLTWIPQTQVNTQVTVTVTDAG